MAVCVPRFCHTGGSPRSPRIDWKQWPWPSAPFKSRRWRRSAESPLREPPAIGNWRVSPIRAAVTARSHHPSEFCWLRLVNPKVSRVLKIFHKQIIMRLMKHRLVLTSLLLLAGSLSAASAEAPIPLPEHPRPDFQRADWHNLNGPWSFRFD